MENCSCQYCYHEVCFHPLRGEEAGLGIPCDGCDLEDIPQMVTADTAAAFTILLK